MNFQVLRTWWRSDFDYSWLPEFLDRRGLNKLFRTAIGGSCLIFAFGAMLNAISRAGPTSSVARSVVLVLALSSIYAGIRWSLAPWPTERRSLTFLVWAELSLTAIIAVGSHNPLSTLPACGLFVITGIYVALMHSPRVLAMHLAAALTVCAAISVHVARTTDADVPFLLARMLVIASLVVMTPLVLQIGMSFLAADAQVSHRDPLTELLNRRGLIAGARQLVTTPLADGTALVASVIDLDNFKKLNDGRGHASGDTALRVIGARLKAAVPSEGFVGRLGGDEFAVLCVVPAGDARSLAHAIHRAVYCQSDHDPITASTGVWVSTVHPLYPLDGRVAFDEVIKRADFAMYQAKRSGGNRLVRLFDR